MEFLYNKIDALCEAGYSAEIPNYVLQNLNSRFQLREYQKKAFINFITYFENDRIRCNPSQLLFHMATGSGKTLIMAGLILYLYNKGYNKFLFFVNLSNIIEKTKENFLNHASLKYLFNNEIIIDGKCVDVQEVTNFQDCDPNKINICFYTTQGLHNDMWFTKENGITFDDFEQQKIVLISDEAHHLNVDTKKKMSAEESDSYHSWEYTIKNLFERNKYNILLEFTATCDLENQSICSSYQNKIIFDYPLKMFYKDKFSKDIIALRSDLGLMERALQALLFSQYRLKIFQDNKLNIKPVVLFKSSKIDDSKKFMAQFIETVKNLNENHLSNLLESTDNVKLRMVYNYFSSKNISYSTLAQELRDDFSEEHCVSVNDDTDLINKQILLNSLENPENPYRAIFEVKKLDEGWDVLNLFDIVRLYETRQSSGKKIASATIAEAQLIGRGARYCPFQINDEQPKFRRKYDDDITNELRICEELYYHCQNDHRYINELHNALSEIGLGKENTIQCENRLKEEFKNDDIYKHGLIFLNSRQKKDQTEVFNLFSKIRDDYYSYTERIGTNDIDVVMQDIDAYNNPNHKLKNIPLYIKDIANINYAIVNKALMKYPIYKFNSLKSIFPNILSTREFITSNKYLGNVKINIYTAADNPPLTTMFNAVLDIVGKISELISNLDTMYTGTKDFTSRKICEIFHDKTVNYSVVHEQGSGVSQNDLSVDEKLRIDLSKSDWYAYIDSYGTSEEKSFIAYFADYVNKLKKVYNKVFLVRNEREFHIYSFNEGARFEPDYVLFLQKNKSDGYEQLQIFIEPKGDFLLERDEWKEQFLLQMQTDAVLIKNFVDDNKYKIWGLHFYNKKNRTKEFQEDFSQLFLDDI